MAITAFEVFRGPHLDSQSAPHNGKHVPADADVRLVKELVVKDGDLVVDDDEHDRVGLDDGPVNADGPNDDDDHDQPLRGKLDDTHDDAVMLHSMDTSNDSR